MAYPRARSVNAELHEGMTDGSFKKVIQNRGGEPEELTGLTRAQLSVKGYGIVEAQRKWLPDGSDDCNTPYTTPTRDPEALGY